MALAGSILCCPDVVLSVGVSFASQVYDALMFSPDARVCWNDQRIFLAIHGAVRNEQLDPVESVDAVDTCLTTDGYPAAALVHDERLYPAVIAMVVFGSHMRRRQYHRRHQLRQHNATSTILTVPDTEGQRNYP